MLAGAIANAKATGMDDVAEYLALKQSNDLIRQTSVEWLFNSLIEIATDESVRNLSVVIEREEPHEFALRGARMAGSLIRLRHGVRCFTVEAGWTRTPSHGFMRGGALAAARIAHFGLPAVGVELVLMRVGETPVWSSADGRKFDSQSLREHFVILLGN